MDVAHRPHEPNDTSAASDEDSEAELLAALSSPAPSKIKVVPSCATLSSHGALAGWPIEVRLSIAVFVPWSELVRHTLLCRAMWVLEKEDVLWRLYFELEWPRLAQRKVAGTDQAISWRSLFRSRWGEANRGEDAVAEDWLDFSAAQALGSPMLPAVSGPASGGSSAPEGLQHAIVRCKEDLERLYGIHVPRVVQGACERACRYRKVPIDGAAYVCEQCGRTHVCNPSIPCEGSMQNGDNFLVCPVSGTCWREAVENVDDQQEAGHDWDPELSAAQQHGIWFEQGYNMSEDQATSFFGARLSQGCSQAARR